jgi:hypothetical protein
MDAIKFKGANIVFAENQEEYNSLPAFKDDEGNVVTCWKLSDEEIKKITETGELWLSVSTFNQPLQPVLLSVNKSDVLIEN